MLQLYKSFDLNEEEEIYEDNTEQLNNKDYSRHQSSKNREMVVVRALKDILSIKIKTRHDGVCDQFSRLFMTKMLLISSFIMGFDYFSDRISCYTPKNTDMSKDMIHSACWISGFYIYKEMRDRLYESSYYGIPQKMDYDGINVIDQLCDHKHLFNEDEGCRPMTKIFYLQYQWLPFYIGALALIYYLPYIIFRLVNTDLISLKNVVKSASCDADSVVRNYFNYKINTVIRLRLRIWLNIFVKILYMIANLFGFYFTDYVLLGNYVKYGAEYIRWAKLNTTEAHDKTQFRLDPKPGNVLLPSMGFCEITEAYIGTQVAFHNENKFICEISTNILYQYVLIVLWFLFVISISVSILGFVSNIAGHFYHVCCIGGVSTPKKSITRFITLRETEYLIFIKKKNLVLYGDVLRKLRQMRADLHGKVADGFETSNGFVKPASKKRSLYTHARDFVHVKLNTICRWTNSNNS